MWSGSNVSGLNLDDFCRLRGMQNDPAAMQALYETVRNSAYEIIRRKGATYYGIAMAVSRIAECIVKDEHAVLPVSVVLHGEYGLEELSLSIPAILGSNGVEQVLEIPLNSSERMALTNSAGQLRDIVQRLPL